MVKQGVDQRSIWIARTWMHNQPRWLVEHNDRIIFEQDFERYVLWLRVGVLGRWNRQFDVLIPLELKGWVVGTHSIQHAFPGLDQRGHPAAR